MQKIAYVYIITNKNKTTLYTGVTTNLSKRMGQHQAGEGSIFASRYNLKHLVFVERFDSIRNAIAREKQIKSWRRQKKIDLIESINPEWNDLMNNMHPSY
jgi:putative endonuclease